MIGVLHIHGQMAYGGAEKRTVELMPLLAEKGVHFDYCTFVEGEKPLDAKILEYGGNIYTCRLKPDFWSFGRRFVQFLRESDYDIVHTHSYYFSGYLVHLARKAGIKSRIVHFRNTYDGRVLSPQRKVYCNIMHRMMDKHATAILAVCNSAMEFNWGPDWRDDPRCRVIYNGLALSDYKRSGYERESVLKELGIGRTSKLVINVANFKPVKGHDILLTAAAKMIEIEPTFHFLLVGNGPLRQTMQFRARELGISEQTHFLGLRSDVPRLLKASDCFVLASRWEGLPGVVLESVAAQLPVVATDLPGVREIAEHTDLITMVPIGDSEAICKQVLKITRKGKLHPSAGTPFPLEFDIRHCAEKLFEVYTSQVG